MGTRQAISTLRHRFYGFFAGSFCAFCFGIPSLWAAQAEHESIESHGGENGGLPQFDPSTWTGQIFWLALTFAFLYAFFSRKTLPDISSALENRRGHIVNDLETAEKLKVQAEDTQHAYESGLENARRNATAALHAAHDSIRIKTEEAATAFRARTERDTAALENRLAAAQDKIMADMSAVAAEIASEAAQKIVGINPDIEQAKTVVRALNETGAKAA